MLPRLAGAMEIHKREQDVTKLLKQFDEFVFAWAKKVFRVVDLDTKIMRMKNIKFHLIQHCLM